MSLRPLDPGRDLPTVAALLTLGGVERLEAWELEEELARLAPPKVMLRWVAGEGATVAGTAWLVRYPSQHRVLHVGVVVEQAARRRGLGAALWRAVEAAAAGEEGVDELRLRCGRTRPTVDSSPNGQALRRSRMPSPRRSTSAAGNPTPM